jgi:hypothetical protein
LKKKRIGAYKVHHKTYVLTVTEVREVKLSPL